jgi:hypothetical protein
MRIARKPRLKESYTEILSAKDGERMYSEYLDRGCGILYLFLAQTHHQSRCIHYSWPEECSRVKTLLYKEVYDRQKIIASREIHNHSCN